MTTATSYFVETDGIKLPDGSVFGAGKDEMLRVVCTSAHGGVFEIYNVVGHNLVRTSDSWYTYKQMKKFVADFINYQIGLGNRVYHDKLGQILSDDGRNTVFADHPELR